MDAKIPPTTPSVKYPTYVAELMLTGPGVICDKEIKTPSKILFNIS